MAMMAKAAGSIGFSASNAELALKVAELFNDLRPGVSIHISQHIVAQKKLNTGYNRCYLTEAGRGRRRLFIPGDEIHLSRKTPSIKTVPDSNELPAGLRHMLKWYRDQCKKTELPLENMVQQGLLDDSVVPSDENGSLIDSPEIDTPNLNEFVARFEEAHEHFYLAGGSFSEFQKGPCLHFHLKAVSCWKKHIRDQRFTFKRALEHEGYVESIYATLTAWGMHKLGGGPKLKDWRDFKLELLKIADGLETVRDASIVDLQAVKGVVEKIFNGFDPSRNVRNMVAKAKTLHHLNPALFPPIDRRYTLSLLSRMDGIEAMPSLYRNDVENYTRVLAVFRDVALKVGAERIDRLVGRRVMDTSTTKVIDNAVIGFTALIQKAS